ncbi:hypothetical protein Q4561_11925 [Alteromonas sp. 1_MG-2023]|uniref:hypothetical protein n=1 Tax=Alteromonas sp. 1_MG-2023 TaxID=3062669 RepID=UPI0026E1D6BE|nr:hypothetical protein [Alteromonas sp. 1_MG-2023]MDO6567769.1 hypothetical protein [Alteromonas sp. 1_MG-2023]
MILRKLARDLVTNWKGTFTISIRGAYALLFAIFIMAGSVGSAFAHALPGSVLVFSENEDQLHVTITFSLDDLVIVEPEFERLADAEIGTSLTEEKLTALCRYIEPHIALSQTSNPLPVELINATITEASNEHVGKFSQVKLQMVASTIEPTDTLPITLTYDALMHEIRSHRATVYWQNDGGNSVEGLTGVVDFGYKVVDGNPQAHELALP